MKKEKYLETILVLVFVMLVLYLLNHIKWLLITASILAFIGAFIPFLAKGIHLYWMKLAEIMGNVMGKVLFTLVYIIFVIPLSLLARRFSKTNQIILKPRATSYFKDRNFMYTKESIENSW